MLPLFFSLVFSLSASADQLSDVDKEAMEKTVQLLKNKGQREAMGKKDPNAAKADAMAKQLFGEKGVDQAYAAAAEIFKNLVKNTNGDPSKMNEIMEKAKSDPAAFMQGLSKQHQNMIKKLAEDLEKTRAPTGNGNL